jgi:replicative DNA helicase
MMNAKSIEPLHDREAEQAVLGAMMTDSTVIPRVVAVLGHTSDAFFYERPSAHLHSDSFEL